MQRVLAADIGGKGSIVALASEGAVKANHKAGAIVADLAGKLGGRGGGKPDFAMGGFANLSDAEKVLSAFGR